MRDASMERVYTIRRRHLLRGGEFAVVFGECWVIIRNLVGRWVRWTKRYAKIENWRLYR